MNTQRVLFLCTGNSARSQMAEAFLRTYGGDIFDPYSAGMEPKDVNPLTVKVMNEVGIDISKYQSKSLDVYSGKVSFQYLITVCDDADKNCPVGIPGVKTRIIGCLKTWLNLKALRKKSFLNSERYGI